MAGADEPVPAPSRVVCFGELLMRLAARGREALLQSPPGRMGLYFLSPGAM